MSCDSAPDTNSKEDPVPISAFDTVLSYYDIGKYLNTKLFITTFTHEKSLKELSIDILVIIECYNDLAIL